MQTLTRELEVAKGVQAEVIEVRDLWHLMAEKLRSTQRLRDPYVNWLSAQSAAQMYEIMRELFFFYFQAAGPLTCLACTVAMSSADDV